MNNKFFYLVLLILIMFTGFTFNGWRNQMADGNHNYQIGEVDQAIQSFNQALVEAPDEPALHYNLANALYRQGDFSRAKEQYSKSLELTTDQELLEEVEYNLGNLEFRQGESLIDENPLAALNQFEIALQQYEKVLRADSTDQDAKYNYEFVQKKISQLKNQLAEEQDQTDNSSEEVDQDERKDLPPDQPDSSSGQKDPEQKNTEAVESWASEDAEKDTAQPEVEQTLGLSEEAARQLLEQFKDEIDQFIPIQPQAGQQSKSFKDW